MDESNIEEGRLNSILKSRNRFPLQEVQGFFPEDDTVTTTFTRNRRVSFGRKCVKEFQIGSAVSTQALDEYEQSASFSDPSECSGPLDLALDKTCQGPETEENKESDLITPPECFSDTKPRAPEDRARLFTENCISIAKSVFQDTETELTAIIIGAKPTNNDDERKNMSNVNFSTLDISHDFVPVRHPELKFSEQSHPVDKSRFDFLDHPATNKLGMKTPRTAQRTPLARIATPWDDENNENIPPAHRSYRQVSTPMRRELISEPTMEFTCANLKSNQQIICNDSVNYGSDMEDTCGRRLVNSTQRSLDMCCTRGAWNNVFDEEDPLKLDAPHDDFLADLADVDKTVTPSDTEDSPYCSIQKELANLSVANKSFRDRFEQNQLFSPAPASPLILSPCVDPLLFTPTCANIRVSNDDMEMTEARAILPSNPNNSCNASVALTPCSDLPLSPTCVNMHFKTGRNDMEITEVVRKPANLSDDSSLATFLAISPNGPITPLQFSPTCQNIKTSGFGEMEITTNNKVEVESNDITELKDSGISPLCYAPTPMRKSKTSPAKELNFVIVESSHETSEPSKNVENRVEIESIELIQSPQDEIISENEVDIDITQLNHSKCSEMISEVLPGKLTSDREKEVEPDVNIFNINRSTTKDNGDQIINEIDVPSDDENHDTKSSDNNKEMEMDITQMNHVSESEVGTETEVNLPVESNINGFHESPRGSEGSTQQIVQFSTAIKENELVMEISQTTNTIPEITETSTQQIECSTSNKLTELVAEANIEDDVHLNPIGSETSTHHNVECSTSNKVELGIENSKENDFVMEISQTINTETIPEITETSTQHIECSTSNKLIELVAEANIEDDLHLNLIGSETSTHHIVECSTLNKVELGIENSQLTHDGTENCILENEKELDSNELSAVKESEAVGKDSKQDIDRSLPENKNNGAKPDTDEVMPSEVERITKVNTMAESNIELSEKNDDMNIKGVQKVNETEAKPESTSDEMMQNELNGNTTVDTVAESNVEISEENAESTSDEMMQNELNGNTTVETVAESNVEISEENGVTDIECITKVNDIVVDKKKTSVHEEKHELETSAAKNVNEPEITQLDVHNGSKLELTINKHEEGNKLDISAEINLHVLDSVATPGKGIEVRNNSESKVTQVNDDMEITIANCANQIAALEVPNTPKKVNNTSIAENSEPAKEDLNLRGAESNKEIEKENKPDEPAEVYTEVDSQHEVSVKTYSHTTHDFIKESAEVSSNVENSRKSILGDENKEIEFGIQRLEITEENTFGASEDTYTYTLKSNCEKTYTVEINDETKVLENSLKNKRQTYVIPEKRSYSDSPCQSQRLKKNRMSDSPIPLRRSARLDASLNRSKTETSQTPKSQKKDAFGKRIHSDSPLIGDASLKKGRPSASPLVAKNLSALMDCDVSYAGPTRFSANLETSITLQECSIENESDKDLSIVLPETINAVSSTIDNPENSPQKTESVRENVSIGVFSHEPSVVFNKPSFIIEEDIENDVPITMNTLRENSPQRTDSVRENVSIGVFLHEPSVVINKPSFIIEEDIENDVPITMNTLRENSITVPNLAVPDLDDEDFEFEHDVSSSTKKIDDLFKNSIILNETKVGDVTSTNMSIIDEILKLPHSIDLPNISNINSTRNVSNTNCKEDADHSEMEGVETDLFEQTYKNVKSILEEKSKTNDCNWKILKSQSEDNTITLEFPLLEAGLLLQVIFDKSSKIISLKTSEKSALPYQTKIKTYVNMFGYNFLKNLIKNQEEKLKCLEELPMFIDLFSGFAKRLVEAMNDALVVLKGCASAELRENILSFRINYYTPLTSCLVDVDLNELAMLGQPSISLRHEMGRVSEQTLRHLMPKPQRNLLQVFVKAVTNYTIDLEAKTGFVTKRPELLF